MPLQRNTTRRSKAYLTDASALFEALTELETLYGEAEKKFQLYLYFFRDTHASDNVAAASISRLEGRLANVDNKMTFFKVSLGHIKRTDQEKFLVDPKLEHFRVFLERTFDDAKHELSIAEEKIMNLKSIPAHNMWISSNERFLFAKTVQWKKKPIPLAQALDLVSQLPKAAERAALAEAVTETLKTVAPFSEAELNAIYTNKKINDEIRGYKTPYAGTVRAYRNDPEVVEKLVKAVTENFKIAHRFYRLKARLLKMKSLSYSDRAAKIGAVKTKFTFDSSAEILKTTFGALNPKYAKILDAFLKEGRIDAFPRIGKRNGAYCWGAYACPTFVLLNHIDDFHSFTTFAHEFGHAFHTDFSKSQGPLYCSYSTSLAETASTLFEALASEAVYEKLSDKEKIIVLHDRINDAVATVFRQIACFNFENDLHMAVREKGYLSASEIAELHNKNMGAYLGPVFKMQHDDGYFFVSWGHIRRFFYVYSYAYGMLVSMALRRRFKQDPKFWKKIEQFLSSGGKDSPENIMREIGIDISSPDFWMEGLKEIEDDIARLEKLVK